MRLLWQLPATPYHKVLCVPKRGQNVPRLITRPLSICRAMNEREYEKDVVLEASPESATSSLDGSEIYFESFLRAFCLGVGSGVILELLHVAVNLAQVAETVPFNQVTTMLAALPKQPEFLDLFAPSFYADHVMAILSWVCFYSIDVVAIKSIMEKHKNDPQNGNRALRRLVTLPKRMLPWHSKFIEKVALKLMGQYRTNDSEATSSNEFHLGQGDSSTELINDTGGVSTPNVDSLQSKKVTTGISVFQHPGRRPPGGVKKNNYTLISTENSLEEMEKASRLALQRYKDLQERRGYLTNQWYAVALSENVQIDEPYGADILGRRIVLFRDSITKKIFCMDDACPHRGAPLSQGWLSAIDGRDCLTCPYHGWAFDSDGHLCDVPAATNKGEWPKRPIVPTHDVEEKGGFVWLFFGSKKLPKDARPPIPHVPELNHPKWKAVYGEIEFDCNHSGVFENAIDMAHIHYLHSDSFGNSSKPQIEDMKAISDAYSISCNFKLHNKPASPLWEWTKVPEVDVLAKAYLPSTSMISFTLGAGLSFITFVNTVPISANKSINRFALVRNLAWDETGTFNAAAWDNWARKSMYKILGEDKEMVERLRPEMLLHEYSVRADLPQVAFRRLRQSYVDMGMFVPAAEDNASIFSRGIQKKDEPFKDMEINETGSLNLRFPNGCGSFAIQQWPDI